MTNPSDITKAMQRDSIWKQARAEGATRAEADQARARELQRQKTSAVISDLCSDHQRIDGFGRIA